MEDIHPSPFAIKDEGKRGIIHADKNFFERDCVLTVAAQYTDKYFVSIQPIGDRTVELAVSAKEDVKITENFLKEIMNALIDQQIRLDLIKEFGAVRKTIVNYAFSSMEKKNV